MQRQLVHRGLADIDAGWILTVIESRLDTQPLRRSRAANEGNNHLEGSERSASPVPGDVTEEAMLDLVPFACPWRKVAGVNP